MRSDPFDFGAVFIGEQLAGVARIFEIDSDILFTCVEVVESEFIEMSMVENCRSIVLGDLVQNQKKHFT